MSDKNRVDNTPDELDDIFDQKPGSRLVWIIPSILLHVVIIGLWLLMPEKERVVEKRKVVINRKQAEQLQEFVKDANLVELQMEVVRLQEIKKQMDEIRLQEINTLKKFTKEMQTELEDDVFAALNSIKDLQNKILADQTLALQSIDLLLKDYVLLDSAIETGHYTNMSVVASGILEERKTIKSIQSPLLENLKLIQTKIDSTDSTLSWLGVKSIQKKWGDLVDLQEDVLVNQVESIDKEAAISGSQVKALEVLKKDAVHHEKRVYDFNLSETNKVEKYWETLNYCTSSTNSAVKELAQAESQKEDLIAGKTEAEDEMEIQQKIFNSPAKTPEEKEKSQIAKKEYDNLKAQRDKYVHEIKICDGIITENKKIISACEKTLSKLKFPSLGKVPYPVEQVEAALTKLDSLPKPLGLQKEAILKQKEAITKLDKLSEEIKNYLEADK